MLTGPTDAFAQTRSVISRSFPGIVLAGALASAGIAAPAGTAVAGTNYDGSWSVVIITERGACERASRFGIEISNGHVFGDGSANLQGRVAQNGAVRVSVSAGDQRATGSGRLSRDRGSGVWQGRGSVGNCAGSWVAERRGAGMMTSSAQHRAEGAGSRRKPQGYR
jgi:hypothetical protein